MLGALWFQNEQTSELDSVFSVGLLAATLRFATPLAFAAMGGIFCERSGVINIGLEGMMLAGAFFGVVVAAETGQWELGILGAMGAGGRSRSSTPSSASTCAPTRSSAASRSTSSRSA